MQEGVGLRMEVRGRVCVCIYRDSSWVEDGDAGGCSQLGHGKGMDRGFEVQKDKKYMQEQPTQYLSNGYSPNWQGS